MLSNPYPNSCKPHLITARVDSEDVFFLKKHFPMMRGWSDKIVSSLFKKFIDELRTLHAAEPLEIAWFVDSPTYTRITDLLDSFGVQRRTPSLGDEPNPELVPGRNPGSTADAGPQHDAGAGDGVRETLLGTPEQRPDPQSSPKNRGRGKKEKSSKKEQRGTGVGTSLTD